MPGQGSTSFAGGYSDGATPVPIPNTVVKPISAYGTARETEWESRSLPALKLTSGYVQGSFFLSGGVVGVCFAGWCCGGVLYLNGLGIGGSAVREHFRRRWAGWVMVGLVILGLGLRLYRFSEEQVWADEVSSLMPLGQGSLGAMFRGLRFVDPPAMPLYFMALEYVGRPFDHSVVMARVFSLVWGGGSLVMVYLFGKWLLGRAAGLTGAAVLAFSVMHIYYSLEVRPYSLLLFLELVSVYTLLRAVEAGADWRWWVGHGLVNAALLFTHATGVLFLVVEGIFLVTFYWGRWRSLVGWVAWHGAVCGLMVVWLRAASVQKIQEAASYMQKPAWSQVQSELVRLTSLDDFLPYSWGRHLAWVAVALMAAAFIRLLLVSSKGEGDRGGMVAPRQAAVLLLCWMVVPAGIIVGASYLGRPCFQIRYVLGSTLAIAMGFGSVVTLVRWRWVQVILAGFVIGVFAQQAHARLEQGPMRRMVWTELREHFESRMREDDAFFVFLTQSYLNPGFMIACRIPVEPEVKQFLFTEDMCEKIEACHAAGRGVWIVRLRGEADRQVELCLGGKGIAFEDRAFPEIDYRVYYCPGSSSS